MDRGNSLEAMALINCNSPFFSDSSELTHKPSLSSELTRNSQHTCVAMVAPHYDETLDHSQYGFLGWMLDLMKLILGFYLF